MHKGLRACAATAVGLLLALGARSAIAAPEFNYDGPPITIRLSHFAPATHPMVKATAGRWLESIERETGGKIKVEPYFGGVLHGAKDGFKAAVNDITDLTAAYVNYQPGSFHLMHVLDLPFAFPSAAVAAKVTEELYPKYFKQEYEAMGVYVGNLHANGSYNLFSKRPVARLEDIQGMKLRSAGGTSSAIIKELGAVPVSVPVPEAYSAFQRGVVDGVVLYNTGAVGYRVNELATHMTELGLNNPSNAWAWNKKTWDALPEPVKRYLYVKQREFSMLSGIEFDRQDRISRERFVEQGMEIITPTPEERERWHAAVEPLWEEFIKKNEARGLPARELVNDLRALVKKYESWTPEELMREVVENPVPGMIEGT